MTESALVLNSTFSDYIFILAIWIAVKIYYELHGFRNMACLFSVIQWHSWYIFKSWACMYSEHVNTQHLKYSDRPNTRLIWYSNGRFVSQCVMVQFSNVIEISDKYVQFSNGSN
jgi:hypothetical protein